jgi:hypothetical protein
MPIYVARVFSNEQMIKEYRRFFKPRLTPGLERSYNQGLEMLTWQTAWRDRAFSEVKHFFEAS